MTPQDELASRAARLARLSPSAWEDFVNALGAYSLQQTTAFIASAIDVLPVLQGRAQATARLHETLANCVNLADRLESKR